MSDIKDYTAEVFRLMEEFDKLIPQWANAKALHDKGTELKKIKLQVMSSAQESGSNVERERNAYASKDYRDYINTLFKEDVQFYILDARKQGIQQRIDVLRSLISYEKTMVQLTQ